MKTYKVCVSSLAADQIGKYAVYIAKKSSFDEIAIRWMNLVYETMQRLSYMPRRFGFAEENQYRSYDIHRQIIGNYLALYTIDDDAMTVNIIGFRHGSKLPRPEELPKGD